jgi:hypothetical protein
MCVPMAQSETSAATIDAGADEVELHRDLVPYLAESEVLGEVLKAPLVFMVPYLPSMAHLANEMYRTKTQGIRRAEAERNWHKIVWLHEKPYRLSAFLSICERLSDREYWEALGSIWIGTENLHDDQKQWLQALTAQRPGRARWLMGDADRATLAELGEEVTIYRGFARPGSYRAPSWSLSRSRAEWFANRAALTSPDRQGYLATTRLPKSQVLAYTNGRGENEIILDPATLQAVRATAIPQPTWAR